MTLTNARLDQQLDRACADGRLTTHDADEVRRFADFLVDAVPRAGETRGQATGRAYRRHYPEDHARAVAEHQARRRAEQLRLAKVRTDALELVAGMAAAVGVSVPVTVASVVTQAIAENA